MCSKKFLKIFFVRRAKFCASAGRGPAAARARGGGAGACAGWLADASASAILATECAARALACDLLAFTFCVLEIFRLAP